VEVKRLIYNKRFIVILLAVAVLFTLVSCSSADLEEEMANDPQEEIEDGDTATADEDDEAIDEDEEENTEGNGNNQGSSSGSGFKHEVQMDIDGVVESDQDEGWWELD
jgi:hypothetical protein